LLVIDVLGQPSRLIFKGQARRISGIQVRSRWDRQIVPKRR